MTEEIDSDFNDQVRERLASFINQRWQEKLNWLIRLRWVAVAGLLGIAIVTWAWPALAASIGSLAAGAGALAGANVFYYFYCRYLWKHHHPYGFRSKRANLLANIQIAVDWTILAYLTHFSGGVENPFLFFFVFHMIISSMLLSKKNAYLQATYAILLVGMIFLGESTGVLSHSHLFEAQEGVPCVLTPTIYAFAFTGFALTMYVTVFTSLSIVSRLRREERAVISANLRLEEQDRMKSRYVQTVSHDLRASLASIQSCLQVVLGDAEGNVSDKSLDMITRAERRSRHLLEFVKDLLDLSRMRSQAESNRQRVDMADLIDKVIDLTKPQADEKDLAVACDIEDRTLTVDGDWASLEQVILNLVTNAIRYTLPDGRLGIEMKREKDTCRIIVWDTGIGVPRDEQKLIFKDFFRARQAEEMSKKGTGLGLSIVKQVVEMHGGRVWLESEVGKGSRFGVILPIGEITEPDSPDEDDDSAGDTQPDS